MLINLIERIKYLVIYTKAKNTDLKFLCRSTKYQKSINHQSISIMPNVKLSRDVIRNRKFKIEFDPGYIYSTASNLDKN